jgi:hypothetical protein
MRFIVNAPLAQRFFALATGASSLGMCLVFGTAISAMAQAGGGAVYAITYLDVSTDWVLQGTELIKQYRDTSRREAGNLEFTVLREMTRPNRFAIVEGWRRRMIGRMGYRWEQQQDLPGAERASVQQYGLTRLQPRAVGQKPLRRH